jgi:hypothetical protein
MIAMSIKAIAVAALERLPRGRMRAHFLIEYAIT